jgi:hypothetical protein
VTQLLHAGEPDVVNFVGDESDVSVDEPVEEEVAGSAFAGRCLVLEHPLLGYMQGLCFHERGVSDGLCKRSCG